MDSENSDVAWLIDQLKHRAFPILHQEISGKHLEPVEIKVGDYVADLNPLDKFIELIAGRHLENLVTQFLEKLRQRSLHRPPTLPPSLGGYVSQLHKSCRC